MHCISAQNFWGKLRQACGDEAYRQKIAPFLEPRTEKTPDEVHKRLDEQLHVRLRAMELNRCSGADAVRAYYREMERILRHTLGPNLATPEGDLPRELVDLCKQELEQLSHSFRKRKMCHPSYDGFICFCEHH